MSSSDNSTLTFPPGLQLAIEGGALSVHHSGDVDISRDPGVALGAISGGRVTLRGLRAAGRVEARRALRVEGPLEADVLRCLDGDVVVQGPITASRIEAPAGSVTLSGQVKVGQVEAAHRVDVSGEVEARLLRATDVHIASGSLSAKGVEGGRRVRLGAARVSVDAIIAPDVGVDPASAGRVNVVECHNELGPNALKGVFRLAEYAEFTGVDAASFLSERGLSALPPRGAVEDAPADLPPDPTALPVFAQGPLSLPVDELAPVEEVLADPPRVEVIDDEAIEAIEAFSDESEPAAVSVGIPSRRLVSADNPTFVEPEEDDSEELLVEDAPAVPPEVREAVEAAVAGVVAAYAGVEPPEAVGRLRRLVQQGELLRLRDDITSIWKELIVHHQQHGKRIPHKVTAAFNRVNSLLRKL